MFLSTAHFAPLRGVDRSTHTWEGRASNASFKGARELKHARARRLTDLRTGDATFIAVWVPPMKHGNDDLQAPAYSAPGAESL